MEFLNAQKSLLFKTLISPEYCLHINKGLFMDTIVVDSEAKGTEASIEMCYPQLIAICGSVSIGLHKMGLQREDCVVLGIGFSM